MNRLRIEATWEDFIAPNRALYFWLYIDDQRWPPDDDLTVDLQALKDSVSGDRSFMIFVCRCGVVDCGNRSVHVRQAADKIYWRYISYKHVGTTGDGPNLRRVYKRRRLDLTFDRADFLAALDAGLTLGRARWREVGDELPTAHVTAEAFVLYDSNARLLGEES